MGIQMDYGSYAIASKRSNMTVCNLLRRVACICSSYDDIVIDLVMEEKSCVIGELKT